MLRASTPADSDPVARIAVPPPLVMARIAVPVPLVASMAVPARPWPAEKAAPRELEALRVGLSEELDNTV